MMRGAVKPVLGFLGIGVSEDRREEETMIVLVLELLLLLLLLLLFFLHCKVSQLLGFVASGFPYHYVSMGSASLYDAKFYHSCCCREQTEQQTGQNKTKQKLSNP
jgi:hypothetical protein